MIPSLEPASLQAARAQADLGLPLDRPTRLRWAKRVIYRVSWLFLSHQVAFNHHVIDTVSETLEDMAKRQEQLSDRLNQQLERGLRQANREIGDHVALVQSELAGLRLEIARLTAALGLPGADSPGDTAAGPESQR